MLLAVVFCYTELHLNATVMPSSTQYLFLFTIGPVQSFIAQARKTRDLYAGSAILGEIIDAAITVAKSHNQENKIIVPDPDLKAKPNRFLARIITEDPRKFGNDVEQAARSKWVSLALKGFVDAGVCNIPGICRFDNEQKQKFNCEALAQVKPAGAAAQIEDLLEVYWVLLPFDGSTDKYQEKHDELQKRLAATKNTRQFNQIDEPPARKCSLDGERNALYYRPAESGRGAVLKEMHSKFLLPDTELLNDFQLLDFGEGLSAVSLVKRFYAKGDGFPSTPRIALLNILDKIEASSVGRDFSSFFTKGRSSSLLNEQLYFEENLTPTYFRKNGYSDLVEKLPTIHKSYKCIEREFGNHMSKYYALLVFDGDSMGRIWSGDGIADPNRLIELHARASGKLQIFQQLLGQRLGIYAAYAKAYLDGAITKLSNEDPEGIWGTVLNDSTYRKYLEKVISQIDDADDRSEQSVALFLDMKKGKAIYAGGDDFLGFINLNYLFSAMKDLREAYYELVSKPLAEFYDGNPAKLTFSAGIAIAHYKMPLNEVLKWAHEMEHEAKKINEGKDAFAIAVLKHSGEIEKTRYNWKDENDTWLTGDMDYIVRELQAKKISNNFIKAIAIEFRGLAEVDTNGTITCSNLVYSELPRLIKRSLNRDPGETHDVYHQRCEVMIDHVQRLFDEAFTCNSITGRKQTHVKSLTTFLSALNICDFIKRETVHEQE